MSVSAASNSKLNPLQIRQKLNLSRERLSRLLHMSAKTLERWEKRNEILDPEANRIFAKMKEISELLHAVYVPEGAEVFLATPQAVFGGRTALDLMSLGEFDKVIAALAADYEGLGQ